jgi:hypothetical protein
MRKVATVLFWLLAFVVLAACEMRPKKVAVESLPTTYTTVDGHTVTWNDEMCWWEIDRRLVHIEFGEDHAGRAENLRRGDLCLKGFKHQRWLEEAGVKPAPRVRIKKDDAR